MEGTSCAPAEGAAGHLGTEEEQMRELRFAGRYVKRYAWRYLLGILALFIVDYVNTYIPQLTGEITDGLEQGVLGMDGIMRLIFLVLALGLIITVGRFCWRYFIFGSARTIEKEMRNDMFSHLEEMSMRYYNTHKTGDLMSRFINDLGSVRQLLGMTIITTFDASVMLILVMSRMILYVSPKLTMVAVIPLLVIIFGNVFYGKAMHQRFLAKQEAFSDLTDQVQEAVSGIRVIKAFVQERKELAAFAVANRNCKEKNMGVVRLQALVMPLLDMIVGTASLLTLLYGGYLAIHGEITVGQFIAFNSYIGMLVWPMIAVGDCITSISQGLASMKRILHIHDAKPDIVDGPEMDEGITHLEGDIRLSGLTFAYPDSQQAPALHGIDLHIPKGSSLAILGRTGSGKTTLANLLLRLYNTDPGMIVLDGHNQREIPLSVLRQEIAYVPQDNFLFSDTIENNIAFGVKGATHEQVEAAAKAACIHDNIMDFPDGYQTVVGERGATISGGQKQRSSIARALLKDSPILILDDALSAVDTDTEEQILENLKVNRAGKTTIIIAHRISTIQSADRILVLDDGGKAEYGTHEELMALHGIYRSIWEKQQLEKQLHEKGGDAE